MPSLITPVRPTPTARRPFPRALPQRRREVLIVGEGWPPRVWRAPLTPESG